MGKIKIPTGIKKERGHEPFGKKMGRRQMEVEDNLQQGSN